MYDRFLIQLPTKASPSKDEMLLAEVLQQLDSEFEIRLNPDLFLHPINYTNPKGKLQWKNSSMRSVSRKDPQLILKRNVYNMAKNIENFGLLMTQLTWSGMLKMSEKYVIMKQSTDLCRAVEMMCIVLSKDSSLFCRFIAALRMTDNTELAHVLDVHDRELSKKKQLMLICDSSRRKSPSRRSATSVSSAEDAGHEVYIFEPNSPLKKRKTSADSGFEDDLAENNECNDDAAEVSHHELTMSPVHQSSSRVPSSSSKNQIAIQKGCEDTKSSVVLCKCGDYHQFPKWKLMSANPKKVNASEKSLAETPKKSQRTILHPVTSVEIGCDYMELNSFEQSSKFTKPRRSCEFHKLRFHRSCKAGSDCSNDENRRVGFCDVSLDDENEITASETDNSDSDLKVKKKHPFSRLFKVFM